MIIKKIRLDPGASIEIEVERESAWVKSKLGFDPSAILVHGSEKRLTSMKV